MRPAALTNMPLIDEKLGNMTIKNMEKQGKERSEICEMLKEKFGEKNLDVKV